MLYRDVLVDVLAEECGINEHVSHCYEWNEITQHVTSMVSDEVLISGSTPPPTTIIMKIPDA